VQEGVVNMYTNLELEMFKNKIGKTEIADVLNIGYNTVLAKLKGKQPFKLDECFLIREKFFPSETVDHLFATDNTKAS